MLVSICLSSCCREIETSLCIWIKVTSTICKTQCQKFEMKMWISVGLFHLEALYMKTTAQELSCPGLCYDNGELLLKPSRGLCVQWGSSASGHLTCLPSDKRQKLMVNEETVWRSKVSMQGLNEESWRVTALSGSLCALSGVFARKTKVFILTNLEVSDLTFSPIQWGILGVFTSPNFSLKRLIYEVVETFLITLDCKEYHMTQ